MFYKKQKHLTAVLMIILLILSGLVGAGIFLIKKQLQTDRTDEIGRQVAVLVEPYLNENGAFEYEPEQLTDAAKQVYTYAQSLKEEGVIAGCSYCEEGYSVAFFMKDGTTTVYFPDIEDCYSGTEDEAFLVATFNHFTDEKLDAMLAEKWHDSDPTKAIRKEFPKSGAAIYDHTLTVDGMKTVFGTLDAQDVRAIFWKGHGGVYTAANGEKVFSFRLGEDVSSQKEQVYREDRKAAGAEVPGVVKATGSEGIEQYAITYKFVEKYMCQKSGGLFFTVSCMATADGMKMAHTILDKGFEAYVGSSDVVQCTYGNMLVEEVAQNLCQKDEKGLYKTILDAFTQAQSSLADIRQLNQLDVFIARFAQVFACFSVVQTSDFRLVDRSKIYCTLTSEDGTVDLSKLSVKAVRTDNKHASFDSRISGADLVKQEGRFFLCSRATDVSCNLDISYGSALLKKISVDEINADTKDLTVDLSAASLDIIVQDEKEQFLEDASVCIYGKGGESGVEWLIQMPSLTVNEAGDQVYRLFVEPGTYYVSVTEGDLVLAREEEVQVPGNTTRIYKRTDWEKQLRILTETCDIWSSNEVFSFDISQPICWVSDYDQNGLLEVNLAVTQGSGIFTTWSCYEVNDTLDGVTQIIWDAMQYAPDNFTNLSLGDQEYRDLVQENGCYDEATNTYYYVMYDIVRGGWAYNATGYYAMSKAGKLLSFMDLGLLQNENSTDGNNANTVTTYFIGDTPVDSEESFYAAMREPLSGKKETRYVISRFDRKESEDLYLDLQESAQAFRVEIL